MAVFGTSLEIARGVHVNKKKRCGGGGLVLFISCYQKLVPEIHLQQHIRGSQRDAIIPASQRSDRSLSECQFTFKGSATKIHFRVDLSLQQFVSITQGSECAESSSLLPSFFSLTREKGVWLRRSSLLCCHTAPWWSMAGTTTLQNDVFWCADWGRVWQSLFIIHL